MSLDNLLVKSPVLDESKKAISCTIIALNKPILNRLERRYPHVVNVVARINPNTPPTAVTSSNVVKIGVN